MESEVSLSKKDVLLNLPKSGGKAQWYMRVQRVEIKVFKKPLFHAVLTWICYFWSVDTIFCWLGWIWRDFKQFQASWKYPIFLILCFLGVKLMIVDKPQIPTNIPFYGSMYEP